MSESQRNNWAAGNARNTRLLGYWTGAWLLTMVVAVFGPKFVWQFNEYLSLLGITLNLMVGAGMIWANKKLLDGMDEMQQRIQLDAMALSLGVGLVVGLSYSNLDVANVIESDAEISHLVILMALTYLAGIFRGTRKYR